MFCPDCEQEIDDGEFVSHREKQHPPSPKSVSIEGIASASRFGTDPEEQ